MTNQSGNARVILFVIFLILVAAGFYGIKNGFFSKQEQNSSVKTEAAPQNIPNELKFKDYYSKNLKISFKVPMDMQVEEKFTQILLYKDAGKIKVNFNGTNFQNAKEHYGYLKKKNHLSPKSYEEGIIKNYDYVLTTDEDTNSGLRIEKAYFIYVDYGIYIFSTSDEVLYPVLDQIVQSFEYKP